MNKYVVYAHINKENGKSYPVIEFVSKPKPNATRIYCIELDKYFDSIGEACRVLNIDKRSLQRALNQERAGAGGKHFVRESEMNNIPLVIMKDIGQTKRVYCEEANLIFNSQREAAQFCNKTPQSVMKNCQGKLKSCGNYHFKYVCDMDPEFIVKYYQGIEEEDNG